MAAEGDRLKLVAPKGDCLKLVVAKGDRLKLVAAEGDCLKLVAVEAKRSGEVGGGGGREIKVSWWRPREIV